MGQQEKLKGKPIKEQDKYLFEFVFSQKKSKCLLALADALSLKISNPQAPMDENEKKN